MDTNYETWPKDRLIAKIYDLEAMVESLKVFNTDNMVLSIKEKFKLTLTEARFLTALGDGRPHSKRALFEYVYHDQFDDAPEMKIIDVFICKLRKKIFPFGLKIETIHSSGYKLHDRELLAQVMNGEVAQAITEEYSSDRRRNGENERAILSVLIAEMDSSGRTKLPARVIARKSGLTVPLLPIMVRLANKGKIQIKSQPTRNNKLAPWVVQVRARAL
ncbi:hypothetical protein GR212_15790 [Rhizobium lusitanum]|uniref:OmpR/PhoB-type domain-containing protein n=1 Tax=Rhizobium lusitanum TaxID=293958 RepID=A0A6L9U6B9_9HYPH|nr:helix-turn-helix domain-containing protein [Rhizobium lusitanum]NEI71041.1 hypothetical protein [Rhizobium lusitanum]